MLVCMVLSDRYGYRIRQEKFQHQGAKYILIVKGTGPKRHIHFYSLVPEFSLSYSMPDVIA